MVGKLLKYTSTHCVICLGLIIIIVTVQCVHTVENIHTVYSVLALPYAYMYICSFIVSICTIVALLYVLLYSKPVLLNFVRLQKMYVSVLELSA